MEKLKFVLFFWFTLFVPAGAVDVRDVRAPVSWPGTSGIFFLIVLIFIAVVLTIGLLLLKRKIMPHQKQKELMPWEIALQSIQSLTL